MIGYQSSDFNDDDDEKEIWEDPNMRDSIDMSNSNILDNEIWWVKNKTSFYFVKFVFDSQKLVPQIGSFLANLQK